MNSLVLDVAFHLAFIGVLFLLPIILICSILIVFFVLSCPLFFDVDI